MTRKEYQTKFGEQFNKLNYIMESDEEIIQCKNPYPDYWLISNKGRLFSVYGKTIKIIKPNYRRTGKNGHGHSWFYKSHANSKPVPMQKIIAEHFMEGSGELHHIRKVNSFTENQPHLANKTSNLQYLDKPDHKEVTKYGKFTYTQYQANLQEKAEKDKPLILHLPKGTIEQILNTMLQNNDALLMIKNDTDNTEHVEVEAIKIPKGTKFENGHATT